MVLGEAGATSAERVVVYAAAGAVYLSILSIIIHNARESEPASHVFPAASHGCAPHRSSAVRAWTRGLLTTSMGISVKMSDQATRASRRRSKVRAEAPFLSSCGHGAHAMNVPSYDVASHNDRR